MKKNEVILILNEGLSIEEVPMLTNLAESEELIEKADFDSATRKKLKQGINQLKKQTIEHSKAFSRMIESVTKSDKDGY